MELTLLICTHKRPASLKETLEGLIGQLPESFKWEIVVVDNANDIATQEVVKNLSDELPISLIVEKKPGQNSARNAAISSLKGELIVFTDDDITPQKNWLMSLYTASKENPEVTVFGGKITPVWNTPQPPWQASAWFSSFVYADQNLGNEKIPYQDGCYPSSPNMAFKRHIFDEGIKFNDKIGPIGSKRISGSETEFLSRVLSNHKGLYIPESEVLHRITDNMLQRGYLRKRSYAMGLGMAVWAPSPTSEKDIPKLFGVARYRIGRIIKSSLQAIYQQIRFNQQKTIEAECQAALDIGFCIGIWTNLKDTLKINVNNTNN
jgi:glycosyltransferase involved in cell wall biosynthesis